MFSSKWSYFYILLGAVISSLAGLLLPGQWLLPLLNTLAIYPFFFYNLREHNLNRALRQILWWAFAMSFIIILFSCIFPAPMQSRIIQGAQYRDEMFSWIKTGIGEESTPHLFIPKHLLYFLVFSILSGLTAGFAGLFFGSILLNYMNFYVGSLCNTTTNPIIAILFGWSPWAIVRVIGYILVAIALSEIALCFYLHKPILKPEVKKFFSIGILLVVLDLILKTLLAPTWQKILHTLITI